MSDFVKPPQWLVALTAAFTLVILMMAVAETTLWTHYLIDQGEYVSTAGLVFILAAGIHLHRAGRLWVSLPLALPWMIFPVITQGDQIIDNLTINQMRLVVHSILAVLFAAPLVILCMAGRYFFGLTRKGLALLCAFLLLVEFWIAFAYLGLLMVLTLAIITLAAVPLLSEEGWLRGQLKRREATLLRADGVVDQSRHRLALIALVTGVLFSFTLFLAFKNRPGAYQGSPHFYNDPSQADAAYPLLEIPVPDAPHRIPDSQTATQARQVFETFGEALQGMSRGYYILDRNYNYAFHNALFLRNTPLLPAFRQAGLAEIQQAQELAHKASRRLVELKPHLDSAPALMALLEEAEKYISYSFRRAAMLEEMTARWEQTEAGLQHVTHVYEGEGKILGVVARQIVQKHKAILSTPDVGLVANPLVASSERVFQSYANRIVGF